MRRSQFGSLLSLAHALALLLLVEALMCSAWSGDDAHTLVLLTGIDHNEGLRKAFYDGPNGTVIHVSLSGYGVATPGHDTDDAVLLDWATPIPDATETPMNYDGLSGRGALPVRAALSDEWVVLEKPPSRDGIDGSADSLYLHCRLPLPHAPGEVEARERRLLARYGEHMQHTLVAWLHKLSREKRSGCMFGDGESALTGVSRYYELCLTEAIYRVKPRRILATRETDEEEQWGARTDSEDMSTRIEQLLNTIMNDDEVNNQTDNRTGNQTNSVISVMTTLFEFAERSFAEMGRGANTANERMKKRRLKQRKANAATVLQWLRKVHESKHTHHAAHVDDSLAGVFEKVGEYHETLSIPRWNQVTRAWEILYPSQERCPYHFSETVAPQTRKESRDPAHRSARPDAPISPHDPFWKAVIRLRCPTDASVLAKKNNGRVHEDLRRWAITEMRQLCRYDIEMDVGLVCAWEKEFDSLRVNPIPCVALN